MGWEQAPKRRAVRETADARFTGRFSFCLPRKAFHFPPISRCLHFPLSRSRERAGVRAFGVGRFTLKGRGWKGRTTLPSPCPLPQAGEGKEVTREKGNEVANGRKRQRDETYFSRRICGTGKPASLNSAND